MARKPMANEKRKNKQLNAAKKESINASNENNTIMTE